MERLSKILIFVVLGVVLMVFAYFFVEVKTPHRVGFSAFGEVIYAKQIHGINTYSCGKNRKTYLLTMKHPHISQEGGFHMEHYLVALETPPDILVGKLVVMTSEFKTYTKEWTDSDAAGTLS